MGIDSRVSVLATVVSERAAVSWEKERKIGGPRRFY